MFRAWQPVVVSERLRRAAVQRAQPFAGVWGVPTSHIVQAEQAKPLRKPRLRAKLAGPRLDWKEVAYGNQV